MTIPSRVTRQLLLLSALVASTGGACANDTGSTEPQPPSGGPSAEGINDLLGAELAAATAPSMKSVKPTLKCVDKLSSSSYRAHFGYTNTGSQSVSIAIGFYNRFWPNPGGRGQPTVFAPGTQADVIQVTFSASSAVAWVLGSGVQAATKSTKLCPAAGGTGGAMGTGGRGGSAGSGPGGSGTGGGGATQQCPSTCDDHNPCTVDQCNASTSFQCTHLPVVDRTPCSDGNACTTGDVCLSGVCTAGTPRSCIAVDQCHAAGACDAATGACSTPVVPNGTACSDNNACTMADACQAGACAPGAAKVCAASDQCHAPGVCQPATGVCTNPPVANGTSCDGVNICSTGDACQAGVCTPAVVLTPTHCSGSACDFCSFDPDAGNCIPATDGCDQIDGAADRKLCEDVYACFTNPANHCVTEGDPLRCWCGTNPTTCVTDNSGATQANGPCLALVFAAAKSTDAATVKQRLVDPDYPLGRAVNLTSCRGVFCSAECGVP